MALINRIVLLFFSLLIINILLFGATIVNASSIYISSELPSWRVEPIDNDGVLISRNGQVQVGDNLYFYIPKSNCNSLENLFSFYTANNHPRINMLLEEKVYIKINNTSGWAKVRFIYPFLMGHSVWLSLGTFDMDDFTKTLKPYDKFEVVIIDKDKFVAKEFFDIETNYWYLEGLETALHRGKNLCLSSIS